MIKQLKYLFIIFFLVFLFTGCGEDKKEKAVTENKIVKVNVENVSEKYIKDKIEVTGTIYPNEEVIVNNENEGTIKKLTVDLGDYVNKGQLLAQIDQREYSLRLQESEARLEAGRSVLEGLDHKTKSLDEHSIVVQAKANMDEAYLRMTRLKKLADQKLVPMQDYDTAQSRYIATKASYDNSRTTIQKLKRDLDVLESSTKLTAKDLSDTRVLAPVSGYIQSRTVSLGEYLKANTQMLTIVQTNPLKIKSQIPEKYLSLIKKGYKINFTVQAFPGKVFTATISRIAPAIDIKTRTFEIEAIANNSNNKLKPGLFARVQIDFGGGHQALMVPQSAVYTIVGVNKVFTINGNKVKEHMVELGTQDDNRVEVINAIKLTDIVVTTNLDQLTDGQEVQVVKTKG